MLASLKTQLQNPFPNNIILLMLHKTTESLKIIFHVTWQCVDYSVKSQISRCLWGENTASEEPTFI
jgi:hypothetical protein